MFVYLFIYFTRNKCLIYSSRHRIIRLCKTISTDKGNQFFLIDKNYSVFFVF